MTAQGKRKVIVVGAGVIGASIAYHLSLRGMRVTVFDAVGPAAGASGASDGAVSIVSKTPGPLMELGLIGKNYFAELSASAGPLEGAYHSRAAYLAATNDAEVSVVERQAAGLKAVGASTRLLSKTEIGHVFPALDNGIPVVLEAQNEGHALGFDLVSRFLLASGAKVHRATPIEGLVFDAGGTKCTGVRTSEGIEEADDVIVAAGLGSSRFIPGLGLKAQRGQLIITDSSPNIAPFPGHLFFATYLAHKQSASGQSTTSQDEKSGYALVVDPLVNGQFLIGSTREADDNASHTDFAAVQAILKLTMKYLPGFRWLDVLRVFAGIRVKSEDQRPIVGAVPGKPGLWVATGFASDGISMSALTGREFAKLFAEEAVLPAFDALSPARLKDYGGVA